MAKKGYYSSLKGRIPLLCLAAFGAYWLYERFTSGTSSFDPATISAKFETALRANELPTLPLLQAIARFSLIPPPESPIPSNADAQNASLAIQSFFSTPTDLVLVTLVSNEEDFIVEWLTYHRLVGVTKFVLFDFDRRPRKDGLKMKELLQPWREEGSVLLLEVDWDTGKISADWQYQILRYIESDILPLVAWAAHWDVDEFITPPTPGTPPIPTLYDPATDPIDYLDVTFSTGWKFPLLSRLSELSDAVCVPVWASTWINNGIQTLNEGGKGGAWETVIASQLYRSHEPEGHESDKYRWGKVILHPSYDFGSVAFGGFHNCIPGHPDLHVLNPHSAAPIKLYTGTGKPELEKGMNLMHYQQRSLDNCLDKLKRIESGARADWRTEKGQHGCINAMYRKGWLESAITRQEIDQDLSVRDSWHGRATAALLELWWKKGKWAWMGRKGSDANFARIVLVDEPF